MSIGLDVNICDRVECDDFVIKESIRYKGSISAGCKWNINKKGEMTFGTGYIPKQCPYKSIHILKSNARCFGILISEETI